MIAYLQGILLESSFSQLIINVRGVGYEVHIPLSTFDKLPLENNEVALYIHTTVREDAITLFGFFTKEERNLFKVLINVSGVGGKLANAILSASQVPAFVSAIKSANIAALSKIPGVGKKTAERLIVELKDKLDSFDSDIITNSVIGSKVLDKNTSQAVDDVLNALTQLGFKRDQSISVIQAVIADNNENISTEELLKLSLRYIQR